MSESDTELAARLQWMIDGYQRSKVIAVMAELGAADAMAGGPLSTSAIAQVVGAHPGSLARLLHAAATIDLVTHEGEEIFALTPLGHLLRRDHPHSVRAWAIHAGQPYMWAAWSDLLHSVRTGEAAFPHMHGMGLWDYRAQHHDAGRAFDEAMAAGAREIAATIVDAYDFASAGIIVDVGGGTGALLGAILHRHPSAQGILFDLPEVATGARVALAQAGLSDRCAIVAGDFFKEVPAGGNTYLLKGVLHDWDDDHAHQILTTCRRHMSPGSRLLVIERLLDGNADAGTRFMDLHMLVAHGGAERSALELARLLTRAGYTAPQIVPVAPGVAILEATATGRLERVDT